MTACPKCSSEVSETSKFCPECGTVLRPELLPTEVHEAVAGQDGEHGSPAPDSTHQGRFLPGTKIANRYRIVSLLGKGGMGEVYQADDLKLGYAVVGGH